ncbi:MAG: zf-HC2 domain-containing protein [Chloroflexi bacterium]|nr:zf-HC2 domain-containing protein [Chloroflexota bacterium]
MSTALNCSDVLDLLSAYVDGELSPDICRAIEEHMAVCHDCFVMLDSMNKTLVLYHRLEPPEMPEEVELRLFRVLNLEDFVA